MLTNLGFLDLGAPELIIILAIILLLFGSKNLPKLSRSVADSIRELRKGFSDETTQNKPDEKKLPNTNEHSKP